MHIAQVDRNPKNVGPYLVKEGPGAPYARKLATEALQVLCNAVHLHFPNLCFDGMYKFSKAIANNKWCKWVIKSRANWLWAIDMLIGCIDAWLPLMAAKTPAKKENSINLANRAKEMAERLRLFGERLPDEPLDFEVTMPQDVPKTFNFAEEAHRYYVRKDVWLARIARRAETRKPRLAVAAKRNRISV